MSTQMKQTNRQERKEKAMKLNFKWKRKTGQYQTGESLYLNRICVGGYSWNSARTQGSKDNSITWAGFISLPSLSGGVDRVYGSSEEEVKSKVERVVVSWFTEVLANNKAE